MYAAKIQYSNYNNIFIKCDFTSPLLLYFSERNPYGFYRTWVVPADAASQSSDIYTKYVEKGLQTHVRNLEQQLQEQRVSADLLAKQLTLMRQDQARERRKQKKREEQSQNLQRKILEAFAKSAAGGTTEVQETTDVQENQEINRDNLNPTEQNTSTNNGESLPGTSTGTNQINKITIGKKKLGDLSTKGKCGKRQRYDESDADYEPNSDDESSDDESPDENDFVSAASSHQSAKRQNEDAPLIPPQQRNEQQETNEQNNLSLPSPSHSVGAAGDTVYIQELMLYLNGDPLDQFNGICTADEAVHDYVRVMTVNGFFNHVQTNNLTYRKFLNGYYFCAYDLTCANNGGNSTYSVPSTRAGNLSLKITFSEPPKLPLTLLMFGESTGITPIGGQKSHTFFC